MREPGALLASGRDADIFEYEPGLVLRRSRAGRSMATEARTMEHARSCGYPVPAIDRISDDGTDLVMERLDGPSMFEALSRRPWTIGRQGRVLADLHQRLHEIAAPDWLPDAPGGVGDRLLHLDLHPLNVILTAQGPVVIDWPNARRGDPDVDVALTWALLAAGSVPTGRIKAKILGWARTTLITNFLAPFDPASVRAQLPAVVAWKTTDPHMTPTERAALRSLAHPTP
ncbi:MAG TPA: phosphotransferase [Acidimicrobiales bacterium]|nr:phosphotransferase [Acidimicrobiales bacterium]